MKFRFNCWLLALGCFAFCGLVLMSACAQRLNPLLDKHHGGKPLDDSEVEIRVEKLNYFALQLFCSLECANTMSVIGFGTTMSCYRLECAEKKLWESDKICTCKIWIPESMRNPPEHEMKHCYGYIDLLY